VEKIEVVKWQEGTNLKHLGRNVIFDTLQQIDRSVFHENELATEESELDRYEAYRDSFFFALHGDKIVGYLCYFPITKEFYTTVIQGLKVFDGDIESKNICSLNNISNYIFLLSIAIFPEYQKKGISKSFSGILLEDFSKIKIIDIVSYAVTAGGEHFLNALGLKNVKDMEGGIKLMRRLF
jgi:GNAT superfamily N-acetyltransferase